MSSTEPLRWMLMRRIKSSPICMLISRRESLIVPVAAIDAGISLQVSIVVVMISSNKEVCIRVSFDRTSWLEK